MRYVQMTLATLVISCVLASTLAGRTPDGQTPAEEMVCDGLSGAAFGLCNAYCEATDCGDGVNNANDRACQSLRKNWKKHTGLDELPCECVEPFVFIPGEGCSCGQDLIVRILEMRGLGCPTGQGSCVHEVDIQIENLGSEDIVDPFDALVELDGVGLSAVENFAGLAAGAIEQRLGIVLGPGDNCFDPDCEIKATVDFNNVIVECDESNNTDFLVIQG